METMLLKSWAFVGLVLVVLASLGLIFPPEPDLPFLLKLTFLILMITGSSLITIGAIAVLKERRGHNGRNDKSKT